MKTLKILMVVMLVVLVTFLLVPPANALRHGGGHWGGGRGHYGGYGYGWWGYPYSWGYPYWWNYPYYPYYGPYYYEGYPEPPVLPEGVNPPAESGQQQPSYWHFCQDPEGYYPYVKDCPGGWVTVVPPKPNAAPPPTLGAPVLPILPPGKTPEK